MDTKVIVDIRNSIFEAKSIALEKARCMADDLSEGYFGKREVKTDNDRWGLAIEFPVCQTKLSILQDYLFKMDGILDEVDKVLCVEKDALMQKDADNKAQESAVSTYTSGAPRSQPALFPCLLELVLKLSEPDLQRVYKMAARLYAKESE